MAYTVLVFGMGLSLAFFYAAFFYRRNLRRHRLLALCGVICNLLSSIYLVSSVHLFGVALPSAYGENIIGAHRIAATLVAVLMLAVVATALRGKFQLHRKLGYLFLPAYTAIYLSGIIIFY
ncbi:MAG: hypothetical protein N2Z22_04865 [Turneriella sp.]|nr:hypothetical protein [Leptospiraceae bacterium]MCX7632647.1 hypothetical protein [Turneriella sp.]